MVGTAAASGSLQYCVTIRYREPTYAVHHEPRLRPYSFTFWIDAVDDASAREKAVTEFWKTAELSSVGWIREIVEVEVKPLAA